ncbi:unnamed protein product [Cuscuta campestris]|uniref:Uncharacterized protein n=1 Tax=Cuscuta campestris TaxID=132261 RepID=A0A484N6N1_9ASTE|nr:unnamed protein product [Cuscuta campestris]
MESYHDRWFQKYPKYKNSDFYLGGDGLIGQKFKKLYISTTFECHTIGMNAEDLKKCRPIKTPLPMKDPYSTKNIHALSALLARHIRILLYSGDQDTTYPVEETRKLAHMLAKDLKLIHLRKNGPWLEDGVSHMDI